VTTHRRYTKAQKAEAVAAATLSNTAAAAEELGIPENTIRYWLDSPEFVELRTKTRDEVGERLWSAIQVGIDEVAKGLRSDAPLRDKATAVGILYDKHALLTGGATARSENRDITGTLSDADVATAIRYAEDLTRAGGGGASEEAEGTPEG
jgi:hypothetical protein